MKKIIYLILTGISTTSLLSWEINTHRAIDKIAIEKSSNFTAFVKNSGIKNKTYSNEKFEDYGSSMTYGNYVMYGEENGISNDKWEQKFPNIMYAKDLIEAGTILEDAQWPHWMQGGEHDYLGMADGRFVNHFEDGQTSKGLNIAGVQFRSASAWASGGKDIVGRVNKYSYVKALEYFSKAFTESTLTTRRKYQAKMLVSIGHLMHMVNDMNSVAHTRSDSHPDGDPMEVWARGGVNGNSKMGFRVSGSKIDDDGKILKNLNVSMPKYGRFSDFIKKESRWSSTHFFSKDTIFKKPLPAVSSTYTTFVSNSGGIEKYYIRSRGTDGVPKGTKLAIHLKSYITKGVRERGDTGTKNWMGFDKTTSFKGDYTVIEDNAKILIPRAIANGKNFVNYFFRGQISAKITDHEIVVTNVSNSSLVASGETTLKSSGTYKLMYENNGKRYPLKFGIDVDKLDGSIAYNGYTGDVRTFDTFISKINVTTRHSIKVPIILDYDTQVLIRNKKIVVVYDGYIGKEKSIAVCSASKPSGSIKREYHKKFRATSYAK